MSFDLYKPALVPVRGKELIKPIETLNYAVNLLGRSVGDNNQSAVRVGELIDAGLIMFNEAGVIVAGSAPGSSGGFVKKSGDTMTGTLELRSNWPTIVFYSPAAPANARRSYIQQRSDNGNLLFGHTSDDGVTASKAVEINRLGTLSVPYLECRATGGDEGGELALLGAPGYSNTNIDSFGPKIRFFGGAAIPMEYHRETGDLSVPQSVTVGGATGAGLVNLNRGSATLPGYVGFYTPDSVRRGFLGWASGNNIAYQSEAGWGLSLLANVGVGRNPDPAHALAANGTISTQGTSAVFHFFDRTTSRQWGWYGSGDIARFYNGGGDVLHIGLTPATYFATSVDNLANLGTAAQRWSQLFATTTTINTSDAREKTPVRALTVEELEASKALAKEIGIYQWLDSIEAKGDAARLHCGLTAQRVIEIMTDHNLDAMRYGFVCYNTWPELAESRDAGDNLIPARPAGDRYGVRYEQLNQFIARGFDARLAALESANGTAR